MVPGMTGHDDDEVLAELVRLADAGELPPEEAAEVAELVAARQRASGRPAQSAAPARSAATAPAPSTPASPPRRFGWLLYVLPAVIVGGVIIGLGAMVRRDNQEPVSPIERVLDDPDLVVGTFDGDLASLSIVYSSDAGDGLLSGDDIDALPAGEEYQLWLVGDDGELTSLGVFAPDATGTVEVLVADAESPADVDYVVTVEPAGGSDRPTADPIAATG